ncbi:MAG TPA: hypothetical protein VFG62_19550 [Rhodopila sp.]|jgi:hypothetical protein|nr:hypothetical protein [Rhodopila sp.]
MSSDAIAIDRSTHGTEAALCCKATSVPKGQTAVIAPEGEP